MSRTRLLAFGLLAFALAYAAPIEQWGLHEVQLAGPSAGNPFTEVQLSAVFTHGTKSLEAQGFYDGGGVYRIRFMPDEQGRWAWRSRSNRPELDGRTGELNVTAPSAGHHGPVRVRGKFHFAYADGTPYFPFGTTCYAWAHQGDELEEQTLATLRTAGFNKMRMTVFPKDYTFNKNEPVYYPFARDAAGKSDFERFNPEFFRHFEKRVAQLGQLGIEADIIIFHPYDRWGYSRMDEASDFRYLGYLVARLAAYRKRLRWITWSGPPGRLRRCTSPERTGSGLSIAGSGTRPRPPSTSITPHATTRSSVVCSKASAAMGCRSAGSPSKGSRLTSPTAFPTSASFL